MWPRDAQKPCHIEPMSTSHTWKWAACSCTMRVAIASNTTAVIWFQARNMQCGRRRLAASGSTPCSRECPTQDTAVFMRPSKLYGVYGGPGLRLSAHYATNLSTRRQVVNSSIYEQLPGTKKISEQHTKVTSSTTKHTYTDCRVENRDRNINPAVIPEDKQEINKRLKQDRNQRTKEKKDSTSRGAQ